MKSEYLDFLGEKKITHQILVFYYPLGVHSKAVYHRIGFKKRHYGAKQGTKRPKPCVGVWNVTYKDPVTLETKYEDLLWHEYMI